MVAFLVAAVVVVLVGLLVVARLQAGGPTGPDGTPATPGTPQDFSSINPGYRSSAGPNAMPFASPRSSRPPVARPDATPVQTWPTPTTAPTTPQGWRLVDGGERGTYRIPSGWEYRDGLVIGYETMGEVLSGQVVSFYHGPAECGDEEGASVLLRKPRAVTPAMDAAAVDARAWAAARNTEYEGDYYDVPEPTVTEFTFDDGGKGYLATVSFVPMYPSRYSCNGPAMRFTVAARVEGDLTYRMIAISHIGLEGELSVDEERAILASLSPDA